MTAPLTAGVLLAAGHSRRWGDGNKLLALWNGRPLASWAADSLRRAPLDLRAAVLRDPQVAALMPGLKPLAPQGDDQAASLRAAVAWAKGQGAARLLILLADMPALPDAIIAAVLDGCAVRPCGARHPDGRIGVPACFPAQMFPQLRDITGDRGAGALLREADAVAAPVEALIDVDRPEDLPGRGQALRPDHNPLPQASPKKP
ncbi:nucleotidyltransferase family protein [Paracoccus jeotgali]|uniref:nucleotidyltransferase family protein n=1 Tax=Paracoccus jeotgali TaxID=2065379 RepID=UPI0028AEB1F8|nr:nucleotidyltransferase family protein [Paracoccus jeotgali]